MARDTDRKMVSEAVRLSTYWTQEVIGFDSQMGLYVELVTPYAERLFVQYGNVGQVKSAVYIHYREDGQVASQERISVNKRKRVLELLTQKDV